MIIKFLGNHYSLSVISLILLTTVGPIHWTCSQLETIHLIPFQIVNPHSTHWRFDKVALYCPPFYTRPPYFSLPVGATYVEVPLSYDTHWNSEKETVSKNPVTLEIDNERNFTLRFKDHSIKLSQFK